MTFHSSLPGIEDGNRARRQHQWAWGTVLVVGFVAITVTNVFSNAVTEVFGERGSSWVTASILILLMGVHGWVAHGNDKVSPDTKGDGFYYLGLLFTFASLVFTLIAFLELAEDDASTGSRNELWLLIVNFGIALVTTIVGLAGRVLFTMTQDSPGDVTANATQNLEAAINDMKDIVVRGGQNMEILVGHLKRSADELEKTTAGIAGSAERAESTAAALAKYSTRVVAMAEAFTASVEDFRTAVARGGTAVSGLEERMADTQARMLGVDETLVGFGTALEGTARMLSAVEVAAAEAKTGLASARDGAVREMIDVGALASALGKEVAGVRQEFTKMAVACTDHARATTRSLEEQSDRVGKSAVSFARKTAGLEAELGKTGVAVSTLASTVLNAGTQMADTQARMLGVDETLVGFGTALEGTARMLSAVEVAAAEAKTGLASARDGAVREMTDVGALASTLGNEVAGVRQEFTKMADHTRATTRSLEEQSERVGESAVSLARKAAGLEAELGKTGVAVSTLASTVLNAGTHMAEATSGFRDVGGSAAAASEGLKGMENAATRAQDDLAAVAGAARRISAAETQATRAASDLNRLTDQLTETQETLSSITQDSAIVAEQLKRTRKPRRFRLFWWRQRTRE